MTPPCAYFSEVIQVVVIVLGIGKDPRHPSQTVLRRTVSHFYDIKTYTFRFYLSTEIAAVQGGREATPAITIEGKIGTGQGKE